MKIAVLIPDNYIPKLVYCLDLSGFQVFSDVEITVISGFQIFIKILVLLIFQDKPTDNKKCNNQDDA